MRMRQLSTAVLDGISKRQRYTQIHVYTLSKSDRGCCVRYVGATVAPAIALLNVKEPALQYSKLCVYAAKALHMLLECSLGAGQMNSREF